VDAVPLAGAPVSFPWKAYKPTAFVHWLWRTHFSTPCGVDQSFLQELQGEEHKVWKHRTEDVQKVTCPYCEDELPKVLNSMIDRAAREIIAAKEHLAHLSALREQLRRTR
jgi:hypothetical protein